MMHGTTNIKCHRKVIPKFKRVIQFVIKISLESFPPPKITLCTAVPLKLKKSRRHLKILGDRRLTRNNFRKGNP